ncbi:MAG TPA: outer membrane lipoprotein carrier protein LolA [Bacteroidales bacterium]|nr:outer membrane lipoprotein carrier protein LolA [Bacteroidales bacterium]
MKIFLSALLCLLPLASGFSECNAQTDPQAVKILDNFSRTATSAPSVAINFRLINIDQQSQKSDTSKGNLLMARDQYRLELPDNITWFNGTTSWSYLIREKEVTITRPGKKDDSFTTRPSSIFTLYKKGYKSRLIEDNGKTYVIDLYPEDIKSDLVRIRLAISKTDSALAGAEYRRKDGTSIVLVIDYYSIKQKPVAADFIFDQVKYKGAEINDMR